MPKAPKLHTNNSDALWAKATRLIPTGTQTFSKAPNQYVNGVAPKFIARGLGSHVWDLDDNEFIDYTTGLGPVILGYAYPRIIQAVTRQLELGTVLPLAQPLEVELAELLVDLIPAAEMVRYGKNGSDVTAAAVRLARAVTSREKIAACGYHGWQDWFIGSTSRNAGVPKAIRGLTEHFTYNDIDSLKGIFDRSPGQVAAVIMEPVGFHEPVDGFLEEVRALAHANGALLIYDEIITGFRMAIGGAQSYFGVTPDLATFGKGIANGMPLSALVCRADLMAQFEEVFFSGTFGGEALSLTAAIETVKELQERDALAHVWEMGGALRDGYNAIAAELGLAEVTACIGYGFWPEFTFSETLGYAPALLQTLLVQEITKRGVLTRAPMFISYSHATEDIAKTLAAFREGLEVVSEAIASGDIEAWLEGDVIGAVIRAS